MFQPPDHQCSHLGLLPVIVRINYTGWSNVRILLDAGLGLDLNCIVDRYGRALHPVEIEVCSQHSQAKLMMMKRYIEVYIK